MATGVFAATGCSVTCPFYPYFRDSFESVKEHLPRESTVAFGATIAALAAVLALPGLLWAPQTLDTKGKVGQIQLDNKRKVIPAIVSAALFSLGLKISGMTVSSKIYGFLNVKGIKDGSWDPTLACVMGGGLVVSFLSYQWVKGFNIVKVCALYSCHLSNCCVDSNLFSHFTLRNEKNAKALECPLSLKSSGGHFNIPTNKVIDTKLLIGEAMFGLGWGIAGLCPGPAMFLACAGYPNVLFRWWPSFFIGSLIAENMEILNIHPKAIQSIKGKLA